MMQTEPTISVVVPIYNVEDYLPRCINSILGQTFVDFELLLINDGSTDNSAEICKTACELDNRVFYFYKENGGLSDARNYGIERIRGEYVAFIDSDDWIEKNYLQYLYDGIRGKDSDISTCVFNLCCGGVSKPWKNLSKQPVVISGREALLSLLCADTINVSANDKLFRSSLFTDIRFPKGRLYEDVGTTWRLIEKARSVAVGGAPLYNYIVRSGSITNTKNARIFDRSELAEDAYKQLSSRGDPELAADSEVYYVFHCLSVLRSVDLSSCAQRLQAIELRDIVSQHRASVLSNPRTPRRDKIALRVIGFGLRFYQFAWFIYCLGRGEWRWAK